MDIKGHPTCPRSNVAKFGAYDPNKYAIGEASNTVIVNEALIPGRPPCLTQKSIGKYLQPLTRELSEVAPSPTIDELPDAVIEFMVKKDKAFWVDKPGANAYTLHDAYNQYGMTTEIVKPWKIFLAELHFIYEKTRYIYKIYLKDKNDYIYKVFGGWSDKRKWETGGDIWDIFALETAPQAVFPRSYQYDLDCVKWRSRNACNPAITKKPPAAHCRDCSALHIPAYTPFQLAWIQDTHQQRWQYYPDLTANLTLEQIREQMTEVGRPFRHEACTWYNKNYPSSKYKIIMRKFSK